MADTLERIPPETPAGQKLLSRMLDRLYNALSSGPTINCRPHNSRQRIDIREVSALQDVPAEKVLAEVLGASRKITVLAKVPAPPPKAEKPVAPAGTAVVAMEPASEEEPEELKKLRRDYEEQMRVLRKLRVIAEDAGSYVQDTGIPALYLGFPLLSIPPTESARFGSGRSSRVLAPLAFVPINLTVQTGRRPGVEMSCREQGAERLVPNHALVAWIERQTGRRIEIADDDASGENTWAEINSLVDLVAKALSIEYAPVAPDAPLVAAPRSEGASGVQVVPAAVLGLYPLSNQSTLLDVREMAAGDVPPGPIESFLRSDTSLFADHAPGNASELQGMKEIRNERCVSLADPCQTRAVALARKSAGLVIHGPPGTGKSQTIANIIGDHLARGERVLMVCDKRTAIDVVHRRMQHLGLGHLCALIHDAHGDRRELYMAVREQLERLAEEKEDASAEPRLKQIDAELEQVHGEFLRYLQLLSSGTPSFSELAGLWMKTRGSGVEQAILPEEPFARSGPDDLIGLEERFREALRRGRQVEYAMNPWRTTAAVSLDEFLPLPVASVREAVSACRAMAERVDATLGSGVPPFGEGDVRRQAEARGVLAGMLEGRGQLEPWAPRDPETWRRALQQVESVAAEREILASTPEDRELAMAGVSPGWTEVQNEVRVVEAYTTSLAKWYGLLQLGVRGAGKTLLAKYGLGSTASDAARLLVWLKGRRAALRIADLIHALTGEKVERPDEILRTLRETEQALRLLLHLATTPELASVRDAVMRAITGGDAASLLGGLRASLVRAEALEALETSLSACRVASRETLAQGRAGQAVAETWAALLDRLPQLEAVLRIRDAVASLPAELSTALQHRLLAGCDPDAGWDSLVHRVAYAEMGRRMAASPDLLRVDGERLTRCQERYLQLTGQKQQAVAGHVRQLWLSRQRRRLLASTGGRLNGGGAELKRRLLVRGANSLRLRQVVAAGRTIEGGDPLFDLRPVWMTSPETVSLVFPREAVFDVVIFDEASQCRLEEALPVLTRAKRVVIAGDPRQLPPTRFFEAAVVESDVADFETEQDLFEAQQGEVEDLLTAALNLEIEQSYLDVHYRSVNAALIEFSNGNFYERRLQAIPGHPRHRAMIPPIRLTHVDGIYEKRTNRVEAAEVVRIVKELLRRADPPSIGIACFNMTQRDLLLEHLDAAANEDAEFATRLAAARVRGGKDSFEGLFVKNLENVQGDERDVIIISTTFGPDPSGRFYRRFGPLGLAGGGRRLNVLVTRARREVILVTSIPPSVYRVNQPPPPGRVPNGAWYLFDYLRYAETLAKAFEEDWQRRQEATAAARGEVKVYETEAESQFAECLAGALAERHGVSSEVYWGSEGFCVDLALAHPVRAMDVTIGVLVDGVRYGKAPDPAEWDAFRTLVLDSQGWAIERVWTPHFVRDPERAMAGVMARVAGEMKGEG